MGFRAIRTYLTRVSPADRRGARDRSLGRSRPFSRQVSRVASRRASSTIGAALRLDQRRDRQSDVNLIEWAGLLRGRALEFSAFSASLRWNVVFFRNRCVRSEQHK